MKHINIVLDARKSVDINLKNGKYRFYLKKDSVKYIKQLSDDTYITDINGLPNWNKYNILTNILFSLFQLISQFPIIPIFSPLFTLNNEYLFSIKLINNQYKFISHDNKSKSYIDVNINDNFKLLLNDIKYFYWNNHGIIKIKLYYETL